MTCAQIHRNSHLSENNSPSYDSCECIHLEFQVTALMNAGKLKFVGLNSNATTVVSDQTSCNAVVQIVDSLLT